MPPHQEELGLHHRLEIKQIPLDIKILLGIQHQIISICSRTNIREAQVCEVNNSFSFLYVRDDLSLLLSKNVSHEA